MLTTEELRKKADELEQQAREIDNGNTVLAWFHREGGRPQELRQLAAAIRELIAYRERDNA